MGAWFPAAATTTTPRARALSIAASMTALGCSFGAPRLRLTTRAPRATAQRIASATVSSVMTRLPSRSNQETFTGMTTTAGAAPLTPRALPAVAAMMPATCVPCPCSSLGSASPDPRSVPGISRPTRSGWPRSTPVSITATAISGRPRVRAQADRTAAASRPHCEPHSGSFGAATGAGGVGAGEGGGSGGGTGCGSSAGSRRIGGWASRTPEAFRMAAPRRARRDRSGPLTRPAARRATARERASGLTERGSSAITY